MQAAAVRQVLAGPPCGSNPDLDRRYAVARVTKALAGTAASGVATDASSGRGSSVLPWQSGAEAAAAAERLNRVLAECDALGPVAEWVR